MSALLPRRPAGMRPEAPPLGLAQASVIAVSMKPGATQFTVMPRLAISAASALLMPISPALAAA